MNVIEILKEVRSSPRKMQQSYLISINVMQFIDENSPAEWKMKERIDYILSEDKKKCHCGAPAKPNSNWCSLGCRNKDPDIRSSIGKKNSLNKASRAVKLKETLKERYGVESVLEIPGIKERVKSKKAETYDNWVNDTFKKYELDINKLSDKNYLKTIVSDSSYVELSQKHFNDMPPMTIYRHFSRIGFDPEFERTSSRGEREICSFLDSLNVSYVKNDRSLIKGEKNNLELDVYIQEYNLAIEFHGLYWHAGDNGNKHKQKYRLCKEKGIKLLQIFEDEWYFKGDIVRSIISSKLNINHRIYARDCVVEEVDRKDARPFLSANHIQGEINGEHYGLYYNSELVSIMTVGNNRFGEGKELLRYCTKLQTTIVGGFSKLLKVIKTKYSEPLTTYSDLRYSSGETYQKFGVFIKETDPGYYWITPDKTKRINRHSTQKHKLYKILGDKFDAKLTEKENMINAGYMQIFDCGNNVYKL